MTDPNRILASLADCRTGTFNSVVVPNINLNVGAWWFSLQMFRSTVRWLDFLARSYLN